MEGRQKAATKGKVEKEARDQFSIAGYYLHKVRRVRVRAVHTVLILARYPSGTGFARALCLPPLLHPTLNVINFERKKHETR